MAVFEGAGVALITPFKENGEVNYDKLEEIVEEQIAGGTDAIIACGTTGEASTMTHEEHLDVIGFICDVTKKRIPVVAGTGSNCTQTAIYLSKEAEERGADGILVVSPYYNKATQKGLKAHFTAVADAVKIPMILYNIPGRTGVNIQPETIASLCREVDAWPIRAHSSSRVRIPSSRIPRISSRIRISHSPVTRTFFEKFSPLRILILASSFSSSES